LCRMLPRRRGRRLRLSRALRDADAAAAVAAPGMAPGSRFAGHVDAMTSGPDAIIAVIGLGHVGLPLAVESGKLRPTIGFDINGKRIADLGEGHDHTREVEAADLAAARHLKPDRGCADLRAAGIFIVADPGRRPQ